MPEPDSPDDADRLAFGDDNIDILHRLHDAAARGELDGEVAYRQQRQLLWRARCGQVQSSMGVQFIQVRRCGSTISRSPSPIRLKQNTAQHQRQAGKQRDPPFAGNDEACALRHHDPPFGRWRSYPEADEGQAGGALRMA